MSGVGRNDDTQKRTQKLRPYSVLEMIRLIGHWSCATSLYLVRCEIRLQMMRLFLPVVFTAVLFTFAADASADVFNMTAGQSSISLAAIGDVGNTSDNGVGAVNYQYSIDKYDVTTAQYTQFLNAVAKTDTYGLYHARMGSGNANVGIVQSGGPGTFAYSVVPGLENLPVSYVTWGDAARFVNWVQNGQPTGLEGNGTTETGAYTLSGANTDAALMAVNRNPGARYFIPTVDEWYKAAFYKGNGLSSGYWAYATQSDTTPSNVLSAIGTNNANYDGTLTPDYFTNVGAFASSPSHYGTFDQCGDIVQWTEQSLSGTARGLRGNSFASPAFQLSSGSVGSGFAPTDSERVGFRIGAIVPEPTTFLLAGMGLLGLMTRSRRKS